MLVLFVAAFHEEEIGKRNRPLVDSVAGWIGLGRGTGENEYLVEEEDVEFLSRRKVIVNNRLKTDVFPFSDATKLQLILMYT